MCKCKPPFECRRLLFWESTMALEMFMESNAFNRKDRLNSLMDCTQMQSALTKPGQSRVRVNSGRALHCQCTICGVTSLPVHEVLRHPVVSRGALVIPVCGDCNPKVQDLPMKCVNSPGLCAWCGVEPTCALAACNSCPRSFCTDCVTKHFGLIAMQAAKKEAISGTWACFCCDPTPLEGKDWLTLGSDTRVVRKMTASGRPIAASCNHCKQSCLSTPGRKFYVCTSEECNMQGSHAKRMPDKVTVRLNCSRCLINHFEEPADPVKSTFICVDCQGKRCVHTSTCKYYKAKNGA
eukprot:TRINITY_DN4278_c0_g1_i2.p1 TRINITY_DN4278_c0_g1~~TRINITY_DN4278_c0_g1_i2.p1  ORF type:complete len:294 (-),score=49.46 TRINITY_DN4278_c0_g1_i2:90-971(-)